MTQTKSIDAENNATTQTLNFHTDGFTDAELTPYYDCKSKGVYYCSFDTKGEKITEKRERLSDMIRQIDT